MIIQYRNGDATRPVVGPDEQALIVHVSNDRGGWGRGFVLAVSKRWPQPEAAYRQWFAQKSWDGIPFELGQIQAVRVSPTLQVCNMIAQAGYGRNNQQLHQGSEPNVTPPIRYGALENCLIKVANLANQLGASIHMPRIGTGLAGSSWGLIEPIVSHRLAGLPVTVYDFAP